MDYNKEMKKIISSLNYRPSLLLHSCCAPCSSHCILELVNFFKLTVIYYNPNISPFEEYKKRYNEQVEFINRLNEEFGYDIKIINCDYDEEVFVNIVKGYEDCPERGQRCYRCYELRLRKTRDIGEAMGFEYFTTTLTLSPYKNANWLNEIGLNLEGNIKFLPCDFKKNEGYKHSIVLSKEYNLYRQDYCGCIYSRRDKHEKENI